MRVSEISHSFLFRLQNHRTRFAKHYLCTWRSLILFSLAIISTASFGQADLPKIIPPAPETAALFKYQDYPMDYSTGVPQISIPLYEVQSGDLSVPISLSYHAAGRSVSDVDGPIGIGWSLNAGGMISRTIYGSEDFSNYIFPSPFRTTNIHPVNDLTYIQEIAHYAASLSPGLFKDSEYDVFSYSVNGLSGKLIFKDNNNVKTPVFIPYKPYTLSAEHTAQGLGRIELIDDKGVTYQFNGTERANVYSNGFAVTGWSLSKMISADKQDTISFAYQFSTQTRTSISKSMILDDKSMIPYYPADGKFYTVGYNEWIVDVESKNTDNYQIARLTEIKFSHGRVVFNLVPGGDMVSSVDIFNKDGLVKTISLGRSVMNAMSDNNLPCHKLDEVVFKDKSGAAVEKYSFDYYPVAYHPDFPTWMDLRFCDYWGYYNVSGNLDMVPYYTGIEYVNTGGNSSLIEIGNINSNRDPNLDGLKSGMLKKITFPTGGTTEFTYEHNKYMSVLINQVKNGPGLRVSEIATSDAQGQTMRRVFRYGVNESGSASIELEPSLNVMSTTVNVMYTGLHVCDNFSPVGVGHYRRRTFLSGFNNEVSVLSSRPIIYQEVTEYHGTPSNNVGKSVYKFDYNPWGLSPMYNGKVHVPSFNFWNSPSLISQTIYKEILPAGTFEKVKETTNSYTPSLLENIAGLHVSRVWSLPQTGTSCGDGYTAERYSQEYDFDMNMPAPLLIYSYAEYQIPVGVKSLSLTTEKIYNDDGSVLETTTSNTYNGKQYLSQTSQLQSDGSSLINQITYPFDHTGDPTFDDMIDPSVNMLNFPVETRQLKNSTLIQAAKTSYTNPSGTVFVPSTIQLKNGENPYETRVRYHNYDIKGNPTRVSKENDISKSYIWDYNGMLPIAEVNSANQGVIAYTSFESDGRGNWLGIINSKIMTNHAGITGKKYYDLTSSSPYVAGLSATDQYYVTYWSKTGACTVTGTQATWPRKQKTVIINGITWNYWEHLVSNVSQANISGSNAIDELRFYPAGAQMSTLTYEELVGVRSACDINNTVSYYEYDDYGRLKTTKDMNGNVLQTSQYLIQSTTP